MNYTIYITAGVLVILYLWILSSNKRKTRDRKSRKFMGDYDRKDGGK